MDESVVRGDSRVTRRLSFAEAPWREAQGTGMRIRVMARLVPFIP
jgi:hypothetical protein